MNVRLKKAAFQVCLLFLLEFLSLPRDGSEKLIVHLYSTPTALHC